MKKVIVSMNVTLDGFLSGPDHELSWHFDNWSADMGKRLGMELNRADTILLGRKTYQAMAAYWPAKLRDLFCGHEEIALADLMNTMHKVVYSKTLANTAWNNSSLINGPVKTEISRLKKGNGHRDKSIMVYGSSQLVSALMQYDLVDEYQLWVHPIILGKGRHLFTEVKQSTDLKLAGTCTFQSGVVLMEYQLI